MLLMILAHSRTITEHDIVLCRDELVMLIEVKLLDDSSRSLWYHIR